MFFLFLIFSLSVVAFLCFVMKQALPVHNCYIYIYILWSEKYLIFKDLWLGIIRLPISLYKNLQK